VVMIGEMSLGGWNEKSGKENFYYFHNILLLNSALSVIVLNCNK